MKDKLTVTYTSEDCWIMRGLTLTGVLFGIFMIGTVLLHVFGVHDGPFVAIGMFCTFVGGIFAFLLAMLCNHYGKLLLED